MRFTSLFCTLLLISVFFVFIPSSGLAKTDVIYASHKYVMGDNDTKNDARRLCFIEAKRKIIEKAGTYIESETEIKDFRLAKDEIKTYASAILKVEIASEEIKFVGENIAIFMRVRAEVDSDSLKSKITQIKKDRKLDKKIQEQQKKVQQMEVKIRNLQKKLASKNLDEAIKLRKQRASAFNELDELERIKYNIRTKTHLAVQNIELGMTQEEVIRLIGRPRSISHCLSTTSYNYGKAWVVFEEGIVSYIVKAEHFQWCRPKSTYRYLKAIIK